MHSDDFNAFSTHSWVLFTTVQPQQFITAVGECHVIVVHHSPYNGIQIDAKQITFALDQPNRHGEAHTARSLPKHATSTIWVLVFSSYDQASTAKYHLVLKHRQLRYC